MIDFWHAAVRLQWNISLLVKSAVTLAILMLVVACDNAQAQPPAGFQPSPEQMQRFRDRRGRSRGNRSQPPQPIQAKPEEKKPEEKKDEKKDEGEKEEEGIKTIKRPTDGSGKLDPNRMRLMPDKNGLVQFNYHGHPWADVLQEFADAAKLTFDWQELPADNLNLVTQKKYTLAEARDMLNRHLLARGFTMVMLGEELRAMKIDKLDPSLIPRVDADLLEDFPPHDFVRVLFQLPQAMDPTKAKDDVKILTSPNAKITPLLATKRLLVIDAVANLRSVRDLLYSEQSAADSIVKPMIRQIRHRRADYVADQIMIVLGLDPASRKTPQELQLETQRMQLLMQMTQQKKDVSKLLKSGGPPVFIATDRQQNVLMINAPEDLHDTIDRTIEQVDQPAGGKVVSNAGARSTRPHKTTTASTDAVVSALTEFGQLDPLTRLQSDAENRTIFAFATEHDHEKIEEMIKKIDSTGREIHVIQLRHYAATQVAGTLTSMFGQPEKKQEDSGRRSRYYIFGMSQKEEKKDELGFKAMPDVERNRLIVWANSDEIERVHKMLKRLGETPEGQAGDPSRIRELPARSPEETAQLLERLKAAYPGQLNIEDSANKKKLKQRSPKTKVEDKVTRGTRLGAGKFRTVQLESGSTATSREEGSAPAVNITVTEDGRIVMSSDDTRALNRLEELIDALQPPRQEFEKFKLEHVYAYRVVMRLEEYFAEELKGQTESVFDEWGEYQGKKDKKLGPLTLGRREMLRFISEDYTNTIIVQGASSSQLSVIKQLIAIYDQAPEPKEYLSRKTDVIELQHSRAQDIAKSLKEVYRELLSSKDKEFQDKEGGGGQSFIGSEKTYVFGKPKIDEEGKEDPVFIQFDGYLAVGVDEVSNSLIISGREEVCDSVRETVALLDKAAAPKTTIHVHRVGGILSAEKMQKSLRESLSQPWPGGKPFQPSANAPSKGQAQQPQQPPENNERRRRGR